MNWMGAFNSDDHFIYYCGQESLRRNGVDLIVNKSIWNAYLNNLRYADDTTLMAESEEELKSLLMKMKEESEKAGLKLNIKKKK